MMVQNSKHDRTHCLCCSAAEPPPVDKAGWNDTALSTGWNDTAAERVLEPGC